MRQLARWLLSIARHIKYRVYYRYQQLLALIPSRYDKAASPGMAFVIGCGRSGTTILGKLLSVHPRVEYLFEPVYAWVAMEPRLDANHFLVASDAHLICGEEMYTPQAHLRFRRLFGRCTGNSRKLLIEKTPHNAMRIGYLEQISPGGRYVHIVRDGVDVVNSIAKLASENAYDIAGIRDHNRWWGSELNKWNCLRDDGKEHGYFAQEVASLEGHRQMAAYEWLVTLYEVERWKPVLGARLLEVNFLQLMEDPEGVLQGIAKHLELTDVHAWTADALRFIRPRTPVAAGELVLPEQMCQAFNDFQQRFGFSGRAIPG